MDVSCVSLAGLRSRLLQENPRVPQGLSTLPPSPQQVASLGAAGDFWLPSSHPGHLALVMGASQAGSWGQPQSPWPSPSLPALTSQVPTAAGPGPGLACVGCPSPRVPSMAS